MFFDEQPLNGIREVRLQDKRLALIPDPEMRFRAAAQVVAFFARRHRAEVVSWCLDGEEILVLSQGGEWTDSDPCIAPKRRPLRSQLLAQAAGEAQRATEYQRASERASHPDEALGYLDLARQAQAASLLLSQEAKSLD
jgi:hypothetical protein